MKRKIINLEINEISPEILKNYISSKRNINKVISKLYKNKLLKIYTTKALDVEKKKLYPSQTWASFHTGKPFSEHKCYWYSDSLESNYLIWDKLASKNKSVGIISSIHSSKVPNDLIENKNLKFYLPDCFGDKEITKPIKYKEFNSFNNSLVGKSARITGLKAIYKSLFKNIFFILKSPSSFGISFFSIKLIIKILYYAIKNKNKEFLRMAQFPLIASIYFDLIKKFKPDYSAIFSNHIAGNMHRYWYAHDTSSFLDKNKYPKNWIRKNADAINISIDLLDDFLGLIIKRKVFQDFTICITSSMGQEPNPDFDNKYLSKYDGKIVNMEIFLESLSTYLNNTLDFTFKFNIERNMAPQYGFNFQGNENLDLDLVKSHLCQFVTEIGLKNKVDRISNSIVLTLDPSKDSNLQNKFNLNEANKNYEKYGIKFFAVEDHHSGSHTPEGLLALINPSDVLQNEIDNVIDEKESLNYLEFHKIILSSI
ncbi:hypothetical protein HA149_07165 [Prochlorococcus marinus XMU1406]|uniref:hypothetical protein n=1 Tax=Prochlorococcus marinus TaxID=1219 RepID=UPI001ADC5F75|nr:hypothetical protein [Prochlorococcus marinus]MBO8206836.1 hypothetical protein [Prochlorococcus marinus XMU1406]MCR8542655.1 hypothetical protein [Prochlorococcus marinus XMU1427]